MKREILVDFNDTKIDCSIEYVEERKIYKVSSAQKRLFALNQFAKEDKNYNIPSIMIIEGKLEKNKVHLADDIQNTILQQKIVTNAHEYLIVAGKLNYRIQEE